ncbi:MAG: DUF6702 family protein [Planctomycetaceae bacterium]
MIALIAAMLLHPGHMTRLEIALSVDLKTIEVAMRIDSADMESALKARHKKAFDLLRLSDAEAKSVLSDYLRQTLQLNGQPLAADQFRWVGWQRHPRHIWIYFEMPLKNSDRRPLMLQIRSLYEVEPELRHVVVLDRNAGDRTVVLNNPDQSLRIDAGKTAADKLDAGSTQPVAVP